MNLLGIVAFVVVVAVGVGGLVWWLAVTDAKDLEDMQ